MFTWECPRCGREVDIDEEQCPKCGAKPETKPQPKPAAPRKRRALARPRPRERRRSGTTWTIGPSHVAVFAFILIFAVGAALYISRPDLFGSAGTLQLENVPEELFSAPPRPPGLQDVEVAGVRIWYDQQRELLKVRAVVINHSTVARKRLNLVAHLRPKGASTTAPPLATFPIRFEDELAPREAREGRNQAGVIGPPGILPRLESAPDSARIALRARPDPKLSGVGGQLPEPF